ncbi:MAG: leucine-rich repeat domain-containing protein, partial [Sutterella sp.]|nr:leucine-rich repeat domain-containing protein [Sutterella sp.]
DGVLFNKDKTQLVAFPAAKKTAGGVYTVPETVKDIAASAFSGAQVSKVNMPKGLASIGKNGFAGAALTSVVLPDGFEAMGEQAFMSCSSLTYANIGGAVEVPQRAFSKCVSLSTVNLRCDLNKLTKIGALAFSDEETAGSDDDSSTDGKDTASYNGAIKAIILPDSVTEVGSNAFKNLTGMTAAHIGAGITSGGAELFAGASSLETLTVSGENPVYSALDNVLYAQMDDGLHLVKSAAASKTENVAVQSGTVSIDREAFRSNRVIKSVVIPEGVRSIEWGAFNTCDSLSEVVLPDSLETVADTAFNWDLNLDFVEDQLIVGRINDHSNRLAVLRRRADHCRAADVDILNRFLERAVRTRHSLLEGIEIHADDVDRIDAVLLERCHVLGHRTTGEDARMDLGVERLHAAVEHFGESRVVGHFLNVDPFAGEKLRSAAGRKDVVSRLDEAAGELDDARLIRNGEECLLAHVYFSLNFLEVPRAGSIPCSWSFLRKVFRLMPSNWAAAH